MRMENKVAIITGGGTGIGKETALLFAKEVANMVLFLASDESSFSTGAEIVIDGGATAK